MTVYILFFKLEKLLWAQNTCFKCIKVIQVPPDLTTSHWRIEIIWQHTFICYKKIPIQYNVQHSRIVIPFQNRTKPTNTHKNRSRKPCVMMNGLCGTYSRSMLSHTRSPPPPIQHRYGNRETLTPASLSKTESKNWNSVTCARAHAKEHNNTLQPRTRTRTHSHIHLCAYAINRIHRNIHELHLINLIRHTEVLGWQWNTGIVSITVQKKLKKNYNNCFVHCLQLIILVY